MSKDSIRRQRQHEILIALIQQQKDLELLDSNETAFNFDSRESIDPAEFINRNRRILIKYQALVRSCKTLDSLLDSEVIQSE
ncbi:hypothetical protein [Prochlorococcus marinus]|uniref:hypothetical protein n=1 Tax=Prochlorococcus marinus TaxID=1219 RepID=UPI0022B52471|nr:hypothetical protein [Prochlorococcus marinus]